MTYIAPQLIEIPNKTIDKYLIGDENSNTSEKDLSFEQLTNPKLVIVIGEPGVGKSELLKEINRHLIDKNEKAVLKEIKELKYFKNKNIFSTNPNLVDASHLLLDALDEVNSNYFSTIFSNILSYAKNSSGKNVIITCRKHHVLKNIVFPINQNISFYEIAPFNLERVSLFLKTECSNFSNISKTEISKILYKRYGFTVYHKIPVLSIPRYLKMFSSLVSQNGIDKLKNLSRTFLYKHFITNAVKQGLKKSKSFDQLVTIGLNYSVKVEYIVQCLERLALFMKVSRISRISKEDFVTFILESDFGIEKQMLLEDFFNLTIIKDSGEYLEFDDSEFMEFLAAYGIKRIGRSDQIIYDLAVNDTVRQIYSTWRNTIGFLIELEPELMNNIMRFGIATNNTDVFWYVTNCNSNNLSEHDQKELFVALIEYFLKENKPPPLYIERHLVNYFTPSIVSNILKEKFKSNINNITFRTLCAIFCKPLFESNNLEAIDELFWKESLAQLISIEDQYDGYNYKEIALEALSVVSKWTEIKFCLHFLSGTTTDFLIKLAHVGYKLSPNSKDVIGLQFKVIDLNDWGHGIRFDKISTALGYKYFFEQMLERIEKIEKSNQLYSFFDNLNFDRFSEIFFLKLSNIWTKELAHYVTKILVPFLETRYVVSGFIVELTKVYIVQEKGRYKPVLREFETKFKNDKWFGLGKLLSGLIWPSQFEDLLNSLSNYKYRTPILLRVIRNYKTNALEKYEIKYFKEFYKNRIKEGHKKSRKRGKDQITKQNYSNRIKKNNFLELLHKNDFRAVSILLKDFEFLHLNISKVELKKIQSLIFNILNKYDPRNGKIEYKGSRITRTKSTVYFEIAVKCSNKLGLNLKKYDSKILSLIVYSFEHSFIFDAIKKPSKRTLSEFFSWFKSLKGTVEFSKCLYNFIKFCTRYNFHPAKKLLVQIVEDERFLITDRINSLELLVNWGIENSMIKKLFDETKSDEFDTGSFSLAKYCNSYLLREQEFEAAIWRMNLVWKLKYQIFRTNGIRNVKPEEGIGSDLSVLKDPKFFKNFIDLFKNSCLLTESKEGYQTYVEREIWEPFVTFLTNLASKGELTNNYLDQIEKVLDSHSSNKVSNFKYQLNYAKQKRLDFLGKPLKINKVLRLISNIRKRNYEEIQTTRDLFRTVQEAINVDLIQYAEEGGFDVINNLKKIPKRSIQKETIIQKTVLINFENSLLKRGLRKSDIAKKSYSILRESQSLNDMRTDFIITYGTVGNLMVEIKRSDSSQLRGKGVSDYHKSYIKPYMNYFNCTHAIYLVFNDNLDSRKFEKILAKNKEEYSSYLNVRVMGIDLCK